ncbi:atrial natriuretic peptide receptor 2-like [Paramacrobiotus metropolitanus]|uniref:atrial natriuretic peptide receptor 2-like n=1 Tax=Paramacrobiotus metropolitanus TaxID=2943436 RepID=UPI002445AA84|nr:atrial natriuretic peptide receptor 2-like [Paramacrobiotus metropolitanus]
MVGTQLVTPPSPRESPQDAIVNVSFVVIGFSSPSGTAALPYVEPALSMAVEHVETNYKENMHFRLHFMEEQTCADLGSNAVAMLSEWHYRKRDDRDLTIYIIPACVEETDIPYFHTQWNTLWISTVSAGSKVRYRNLYPTWISTNYYLMSECAGLLLEILIKYNWTTTTAIIDNSSSPFYFTLASIFFATVASQKHVTSVVRTIEAKPGFNGFRSLLEGIRATSRVVLYFGSGPALRDFLLTAYSLDMTNGEYVYVLIENSPNRPINWQIGNANDLALLQAFQSVLMVHPTDNTKNSSTKMQLATEFQRRTMQDFNFTYQLSQQPYDLILGNYMTVFALAKIINDTIASGKTADWSGTALARRLLNQTFSDDIGNSMYIDNEGQRRTDFIVSYFSTNGTRKTLLQKFGNTGVLLEAPQLRAWVNDPFPPPNEPLCGYLHQSFFCFAASVSSLTKALISTVSVVCVFLGIAIVGYINKQRARNNMLTDPWWQVHLDENRSDREVFCFPTPLVGQKQKHSEFSRGTGTSGLPDAIIGTRDICRAIIFGSLESRPVMGWKVSSRKHPVSFANISANIDLLILLRKLNKIDHINICRFVGLTITKSSKELHWVSAVLDCPSRGPLPDLFDSWISKDEAMTSSLVLDYLQAVRYIHSSSLQFHGRISILTCWIDRHFTLKLAHLASDRLREETHIACGDLSTAACQNTVWESFYWSPPESGSMLDSKSLQMVDIYSSGLILLDILTMGKLLDKVRSLTKDQSFHDLHYGTMFSSVPEFEVALTSCIDLDPLQRPDISSLLHSLARISPTLASDKRKTTLFDKIISRLENYAVELECQVIKRTSELTEEMNKCDAIIHQFLPRYIAKQLRAGEKVLPEFFECATITFTDLYGFADFVKNQPPEMTITLTSATEACIDKLSTECGVYKVEAIGDSFMVASGLPERIGINHIERTAVFATRLMELRPQLTFLHNLRFKIGIHSGPCAAGLMGSKRPRYCLFGDTINMASRMCSHGLPDRIHLSPESQLLLEQFTEFVVQPRGRQLIKGKYEMMTYWLIPSTQN